MRILVAAFLGVGSFAAASPSPEVFMRARPESRSLDATVLGVGHPRADDISMESNGVVIRPRTLRTYREGDESIAIAILFNDSEVYVGNTSFETDENAEYLGVLARLESGLDALELGGLGPKGSTIEAIGYSTGASIVVRSEPLEAFQGAQLGHEIDYQGHIGSDLVQGLSLALHELDRSPAAIKLVFIVGDGNDTDNSGAHDALVDLKRHAQAHHIQIAGAIYKSAISAEGDVTSLVGAMPHVNTVDSIVPVLRERLDRLTDRIYLTFDGTQLPWDGRDHDFTLAFHYVDADSLTLTLPDLRQTRPWWRPSWMQLLGGVLAVCFVALGLRIRAALAD